MMAATRYAQLRGDREARAHERPLLAAPRKWNELELQARWFAGEFGRNFTSTDGRDIEVLQFGVWNREAGPDFAETAVSINGAKPIRGSIELDVDARDWERHGHATNPAYESVVLHIFTRCDGARFFTRTASNRNVPQARIDCDASCDAFPADLPIARPGRCVAPLRDLPAEKVCRLLEAAAEFRLQRKAARIVEAGKLHGEEEALYQALATALGYKSNKLAFSLLAQRVPLAELMRNRSEVDALLFGIAGFLESPELRRFDAVTRGHLRELWKVWWRRRAELARLVLPAGTWKMSGARPANHPQRRVAALAAIVKHWRKLRPLADRCDVKKLRCFFAGLHDPYWDYNYTLRSKPTSKPMALVGESRVMEMLANVFFPIGILSESSLRNSYRALPAPAASRQVGIAAMRLFGGNAGDFLRTTARQQGMLQIYEDFCLRDESDCAQCLFPRQVKQWA
jgi:hypothetical protein